MLAPADNRQVPSAKASADRTPRTTVKQRSAVQPMTRRQFGGAIGSAFGALAFGDACVVATRDAADQARLTARPRSSVTASLTTGPLGFDDGDRDGVVQVPSAGASGPVPLLLFLHGATQSGAGMLRRIGAAADAAGVAVLAP